MYMWQNRENNWPEKMSILYETSLVRPTLVKRESQGAVGKISELVRLCHGQRFTVTLVRFSAGAMSGKVVRPVDVKENLWGISFYIVYYSKIRNSYSILGFFIVENEVEMHNIVVIIMIFIIGQSIFLSYTCMYFCMYLRREF